MHFLSWLLYVIALGLFYSSVALNTHVNGFLNVAVDLFTSRIGSSFDFFVFLLRNI